MSKSTIKLNERLPYEKTVYFLDSIAGYAKSLSNSIVGVGVHNGQMHDLEIARTINGLKFRIALLEGHHKAVLKERK